MVLFIVALCGVLCAPGARAWGSDGHRIVGALADQLLLATHAEQQLRSLLLAGESLESVANWLDCAKGRYCGPPTSEMVAYTQANPKHSQYHYTDIPFQFSQYRAGAVGSRPDDVVQTLRQAILVLQGKATPSANPHHFSRRQALLLIAHLVGDIHQPLHVGAAYLSEQGGFVAPSSRAQIDGVHILDARGGNDLLLDTAHLAQSLAATQALPLHLYWDIMVVESALESQSASTPQQFARSVIASQPSIRANLGDPASWPEQWADQALRAAQLAYTGIEPGPMRWQLGRKGERYPVWPVSAPPDYPASSAALAKTQLTQGGYHLAALLRAIWP